MSKYLNQIVKYDMNLDTSPTHVYMDISILNNNQGSLPPVQLRFSDTRPKAVIDDPQEWYMSVIRFHIDTISLPCMIPQIKTGQPDINKTIYSFTLKYKTYIYQQYVIFAPQDATSKVPTSTSFQDNSTGYYFIYSNSYFIRLCNNALLEAYKGLSALVVGAGDTLPSAYEPWLAYDPTSSEIIMNCDKAGYDLQFVENPIEIYFNTPCYNLFSSFEFTTKTYNDPNGLNFQLNVFNNLDTNTMDLTNYTAIQCYQEYPSTSTWSCVQSIILTSSNLPINPSIQASPQVFNSTTSMQINTQNVNVPVISDFEVALNTGKEYKPSINYAPYTYRLIDMYGHNAINQINIEAYWKDIYNNQYPLMLNSNTNANIKILFRKKYLGV